jgi:hypothetical protein
MGEPEYDAGWYPDPWGQATRRWHDGSEWTGHVDGAAPAPEPAVAAEPAPIAANPRVSGKAIAAIITAVLGIWIVPIVLGVLAWREIKRSNGAVTGGWMAITGIVLGAVTMIVMGLVLAAVVIGMTAMPAPGSSAMSTKAKAEIKQAVTAVESCAAGNADGTYAGCGAETIIVREPALAQSLDCTAPGAVCIEIDPDSRGYTVSASFTTGTPATYVERHGPDGTIERTCSGAGCTAPTW